MNSSKQIHIVGLCGSLRKDSFNRKLLVQAGSYLPEDFRFTIADISSLPLYDQDLEGELPQSVAELANLFQTADGIMISTPEFNLSISGALKNALDWLSRPIAGTPLVKKPVAIMGAATGRLGTVRAQMHLRDILFGLNMQVIGKPEVLIADAAGKFNEAGILTDESGITLLGQLVDSLASASGQQ